MMSFELMHPYNIVNVPQIVKLFTFLDNRLLLQVQPSCSQHSQKLGESTLMFSFHQNGKTCTSDVLPAQTSQKCEQNDYGYGTKYKLGDCSKVDFGFDNVEGLVTYEYNVASAKDDWMPEWFELNLGAAPFPRLSINGAVIKCFLDGNFNHSSSNHKSMSFHCTPEGKRFFQGF